MELPQGRAACGSLEFQSQPVALLTAGKPSQQGSTHTAEVTSAVSLWDTVHHSRDPTACNWCRMIPGPGHHCPGKWHGGF